MTADTMSNDVEVKREVESGSENDSNDSEGRSNGIDNNDTGDDYKPDLSDLEEKVSKKHGRDKGRRKDDGSDSEYAPERRKAKNGSSKKRKHSESDDDEDYDDEEDIPLSKMKKSGKKKKSKGSDDDDSYTPDRKKNGSASSSKKKRKAHSDSEEDDEDDDYDSDYGSSSKKKKKSKQDKKVKKEKKDSKKSSSKKVKKEKDSKSSKGKASSSQSSPEKGSPKKRVKKEENEEHVWKWWEDMDDFNSEKKWKTLEHKGPVFAPPYDPLPDYVRLKYDGKPIKLSPEAEEVATFYGKMLEHEYTTKDIFNKNFFKDWKKFMTPKERDLIVDLKKCDFSDINEYFKEQSAKRKEMTKEEKQKIKAENDRLTEEYGYCIVDGHKQKIGNFRIEPPGLFRGRGDHPKMGKVKRRTEAKDVIINIGKKAPVPAPPPGQKWKEVRHDDTVSWLASWTENIMGNVKYIMLNPSSKLKSMKDWMKYEKARELDKCIDKIRADYVEDWKDREMVKRQRAVALYFIDRLALRAGNEKDGDETADTVGCCSLRVEHIKLHEEKDGKQHVVDFDFLGKDSIRYENSVAVEKRVFKNLKLFMENKKPGDDLFDRLTTSTLNEHLKTLMDGLTAKVFRTYNASITLQRQLDELMKDAGKANLAEKMLAYNRANRAVAILCNHQRSVPKAFDKQMENLRTKIKEKKDQLKAAEKERKKAKKETGKEDEKLKKKVKTLKEQLNKLEVQEVDKEENKQIALGTSKLNYLDPRISVAWCKKYDVPIDKVYNKTQRDKFRWAIEMVDETYRF